MFKIFLILVFLQSLFLFDTFENPKIVSHIYPTPSPTKTPLNKNEGGVDDLILDKENVNMWCPWGNSDSAACSRKGENVKVKTFSKDAEKNNLNYYYMVSGGEIIGEGTNVVWNLSGIRPGKYTITASVGKDNIIYGNVVTKTVEFIECPDCDPPCECPTISVTSSKKNVYKGETIEFKADVNGGSQDSVEYNWTVENGNIVEGQGASVIKVQGASVIKVQALTGKEITATVEIGGLCATCPTSDYETVTIK